MSRIILGLCWDVLGIVLGYVGGRFWMFWNHVEIILGTNLGVFGTMLGTFGVSFSLLGAS